MPALSRGTAGVFAVVPTPFDEAGAIDFASLDKLITFYESAGITGLTLLGQMGEAPALSFGESVDIVTFVTSRTSLPVVVGVTAPGFAAMRDLSAQAMDRGASGVMIAPPNTLRTDDKIVGYYEAAAAAIGADVPFAIQDYPLTFSVVMSASVIAHIARAAPGCVMLKHEDWPGLDKISALRRLEADDEMPRLSILCGNGGLFLDFETERGADGAMTGYCVPEMLIDVVRRTAAGDRDGAHDIFDAHLPLLRYEQQPGVGLAVRKYVMKRRGLLATDNQRSPGAVLSKRARTEVDYLLDRLARTDGRVVLAA